MSTALRHLLAAIVIAALPGFVGCMPDDSGTIDLKKRPDSPAPAASRPREFRKGDLEER